MSGFSMRLRSAPRHIVSHVLCRLRPSELASDPRSPRAWVSHAIDNLDRLPAATQALIANHNLTPNSRKLWFYQNIISKNAAPVLTSLARDLNDPTRISAAIDEIIRWKTIAECAHIHRAGGYFDVAERDIGFQWKAIIWPIIQNENFTSTVDLACGHGRNTEFLRLHAKSIDLVDVNQTCLDASRERFGTEMEGCKFRYHLTTGADLGSIEDNSITFGYSWDSMVHFDKLVVRDYLFEFARILKPAGTAFLHHSNFGAIAPDSDWVTNHGCRSDMSRDIFNQYAAEAGLSIKSQRLSGRADGWGMDDLDCLTVLIK